MIKVALISLGCAKNTVDSEALLALFKIKGFLITTSLEDSDVIIINTCGFIEPSKEEAINTILECEKYHKKLIVTGCLVERYKKQLEEEMPEVDLFISLKEYEKLPQILNGFFKEKGFDRDFDIFNRVISTGSYTAYLKISEGCDNFCAFCAIPFIRGRFHSYPMNDLITYAKELAKNGCKELVVISQDTVNYGKDLDDKNANLLNLLKELDKIDGIEFIRTLYMYPEGISDELLYFIRDSKKILII
ncbi:MAG: radical SAM protein [Bacilli bacterium]